jgi:magnesium chelatase family protein
VTVRSVPADTLVSAERGETSAKIRSRVIAARGRQRIRYAERNTDCNARAPARWLLRDGGADSRVMRELASLGSAAQLSARGFDRVIRVSRTIADLAERDIITIDDIHEAVRYRGDSGAA